MAVWMYMPSFEREEKDRYFCDNCISKGCSCNINPMTGVEDLDGNGNPYPCCEYLYDDRGFSDI